jgi:hypothetical protein
MHDIPLPVTPRSKPKERSCGGNPAISIRCRSGNGGDGLSGEEVFMFTPAGKNSGGEYVFCRKIPELPI